MRRSKLRSILVGVACFALASVVVHADTTTSIPPGHINALSDGNDQSIVARVNFAGELSANDLGTHTQLDSVNTKLAPLAFDPTGLKVSAQGHVSVDGSVTIGNLPAQQMVVGTVAVTSTPPITGTVAVTNLPATQDVSIVNGGVEATTGSLGGGHFVLTNDGMPEDLYLNLQRVGQVPNTTRYAQLFPRGTQHMVTFVTLSSNHDMHLTCRNHSALMFMLANNSVNQRQEFVHPLQVDECYLECTQVFANNVTEVGSAPSCEGIVTIAGLGPSIPAATLPGNPNQL
jgi:hypothetical protein